jgi:N-acetylneuraminic acid mutarotase
MHTATLLKTGEVLVAGYGPKNYQTCELYNPSKGTWTLTGDLNFGRWRHQAVLLENGKVLVVGGVGEGGLTLFTAELYEP